jgi:dTDP-glucose 4,6-dehydratase/UDP-glucose 4-epimerase
VFSAYGPGLKKQLFWDIYTRLLDCKGVITLFGTGEESRDFIYIDDLVALTLLATKTADFEGEVYNAGSGQETRIKDAVSIFFDAYGSNSSFAFSGEIKIGDPINWRADISKVGKLGFVPKTDLYVGLQSYISWLKELK